MKNTIRVFNAIYLGIAVTLIPLLIEIDFVSYLAKEMRLYDLKHYLNFQWFVPTIWIVSIVTIIVSVVGLLIVHFNNNTKTIFFFGIITFLTGNLVSGILMMCLSKVDLIMER